MNQCRSNVAYCDKLCRTCVELLPLQILPYLIDSYVTLLPYLIHQLSSAHEKYAVWNGPNIFVGLVLAYFFSTWHEKHVIQQLKAWSSRIWKKNVHTPSNSGTIARWSSITFFWYTCKLENTCICRNPRLADKTIVFSEHEVSRAVVMVTR
jgi:hypothetical protein